jgi:hypothetical protein
MVLRDRGRDRGRGRGVYYKRFNCRAKLVQKNILLKQTSKKTY